MIYKIQICKNYSNRSSGYGTKFFSWMSKYIADAWELHFFFYIFLKYSLLEKTFTLATSFVGFWSFFRVQFEKKIVLKANLKECMCMLYSVTSIVSRNDVSQIMLLYLK